MEEEKLIQERILKEEEYHSLVIKLESELKLTRQKLESCQSSNEESVQLSFAERLEEAENEKISLRRDIREFKQRESRILNDYSELEEENIHLQKQLLQLQKEKVGYDLVQISDHILHLVEFWECHDHGYDRSASIS